MPVLSIVIPVYNEKNTIRDILSRVKAVPLEKEVIVVDDHSTDGTRDILRQFEADHSVRVFYHDRNQGKGAALRTGFQKAENDIIIVQDADLNMILTNMRSSSNPSSTGKRTLSTAHGSGDPRRIAYSTSGTW